MNIERTFMGRSTSRIITAAFAVSLLVDACQQFRASADSAATPDSKTLYSRYCSLCHGDQCQGAMGTPLQNMTIDDKSAVVITQKGDGKQMPAFGQELTVDQITGLIAYIHTFDKKPGT
jgi:mono/diheme cytochrome c family protein